MHPRPTIEAFDQYLASRELRFDAVVIGGSALALLGIVSRPTRDFDVLAPKLPSEIADAAREFAQQQRRLGVDLFDDWFNNGPIQLGAALPSGWRERVQPAFAGRALVLTTLGRADLLKTKLFALCERGSDLADCVAMDQPTRRTEELAQALPWLSYQDAHPGWVAHVTATVADLQRRLGHGV